MYTSHILCSDLFIALCNFTKEIFEYSAHLYSKISFRRGLLREFIQTIPKPFVFN
jgi:hypothetical protein